MDDIDDKALVILEAEQERRLRARIDSGEVVSVQTTVVVHRDEDVEEATARAIARHPIPDDGRHIRELFFIYTGVPRRPDYQEEETSSPQITASSKGTLSPPLTRLNRLRVVTSPARSRSMCVWLLATAMKTETRAPLPRRGTPSRMAPSCSGTPMIST